MNYQAIYRGLLRLYPAAYRAEYGAAMEQAFRDLLRDHAGRRAWMTLGVATDTVVTASAMRARGVLADRAGLERWFAFLVSAAALVAAMMTGHYRLGLMLNIVGSAWLGYLDPMRSWTIGRPVWALGFLALFTVLVLASPEAPYKTGYWLVPMSGSLLGMRLNQMRTGNRYERTTFGEKWTWLNLRGGKD